jgi:hypothetical protein
VEEKPQRLVSTNNANDSKGWAFGLEGDQFLPVVLVGVGALGLGTVLMFLRVLGILPSFGFILVPPTLVYAYFAVLRRGKPAHSDIDLWIGLLLGDAWGRAEKQPLHPYAAGAEGEDQQRNARFP